MAKISREDHQLRMLIKQEERGYLKSNVHPAFYITSKYQPRVDTPKRMRVKEA